MYLKSIESMATNKFFKTLLFTLTIAVSLFELTDEKEFGDFYENTRSKI